MADIGIELGGDSLVLTRGRDFEWIFENVDETTKQPTDYPAGELFFELDTGGQHNAVQEVRVLQANDGTYTLSYDGVASSTIDYYDAVENPHDQAGDITDALEGISTIGAGNVSVSPVRLYPVWRFNITIDGTGQNEIQTLDISNLLGWLGQQIGSGKMTLSYRNLATAPIDLDADAATIQSALEALPHIGAGNIEVTKVSDGHFTIEFIGALAKRDVDQIIVTAYQTDPDDFFDRLGDLLTTVSTSTQQAGRQSTLDERIMNLLNQYVNQFFNIFDTSLGLNIDFEIQDSLNCTLIIASTTAFSETDLVTFGIDVVSDTVKTWLNNIIAIAGLIDTLTVDFYWNHIFQVEFVGDLGEMKADLLVGDASNLSNNSTNTSVVPEVTVTSIKPGKARFDKWPFTIDGSQASIKVESDVCDKVAARTEWQLVFLPDDEAAGGEGLALGRVKTQGHDR